MKFRKKELVIRYLLLTLVLFIAALSFNIFISPYKIVLGGNNGIAVLLEYTFNIPPFLTLSILSLLFLGLSFFFLSKEQTISIIYASLSYPIFVKFSLPISKFLSLNCDDFFLLSIYIGIISGLTNGYIVKLGFNNGGINVISNILYKYKKISYSKSMLIINMFIVLLGGYSFGLLNVLYAFLILYINSVIIDSVILNKDKYKCFEVVTKKQKEIESYLHVCNKNYTKVSLEKGKALILIITHSKEYLQLKKDIKEIDQNSFFLIKNSYDVKIGR